MNISSNVTSINAHFDWMNNNASNVARVNSGADASIETTIASSDNANVKASAVLESSPVSLTEEIPEQIPVTYGVKGNITAIKTQDDVMESLLNIKA